MWLNVTKNMLIVLTFKMQLEIMLAFQIKVQRQLFQRETETKSAPSLKTSFLVFAYNSDLHRFLASTPSQDVNNVGSIVRESQTSRLMQGCTP